MFSNDAFFKTKHINFNHLHLQTLKIEEKKLRYYKTSSNTRKNHAMKEKKLTYLSRFWLSFCVDLVHI